MRKRKPHWINSVRINSVGAGLILIDALASCSSFPKPSSLWQATAASQRPPGNATTLDPLASCMEEESSFPKRRAERLTFGATVKKGQALGVGVE